MAFHIHLQCKHGFAWQCLLMFTDASVVLHSLDSVHHNGFGVGFYAKIKIPRNDSADDSVDKLSLVCLLTYL